MDLRRCELWPGLKGSGVLDRAKLGHDLLGKIKQLSLLSS
jgi:hypothetical protein